MPPEDVGDTVGQDPTQGSRLRPKTEQVLPGVPYLTPPATDSLPQPVTRKVTKQLITFCCSGSVAARKVVTKFSWRPWRTKRKVHHRMQFRSRTLRIEHTSRSLERTHQPSPALALLHLAGGLLRRRRLLGAGGPSRRRRSFHAPATLRAADAGLMPDGPHRPTAGQPSQLTKPEKESPID